MTTVRSIPYVVSGQNLVCREAASLYLQPRHAVYYSGECHWRAVLVDSVAVRTEAIQLKRNALSTCSEPKSAFTIRPGVDQACRAHMPLRVAARSGSELRNKGQNPTLVHAGYVLPAEPRNQQRAKSRS